MSNGAKVALTGRLTKEQKQSNWQGTTVVSFSMAVNTTKKEGEKYVADFYNISVWGKTGEFILPRISKGTLVQVYGDLILQTYTQNGQERQSLSVRATDVVPLTSNSTKKDTSNDDGPPLF